MKMKSGQGIPIEQRAQSEVLCVSGKRMAAEDVEAWNPAFDVTPAGLVDAIVTEKGVIESPTLEKITELMDS